ncbi:hypothetical protein FC093_12990 [Ilyomonas limi]|uniref:alpha-L-fucosidase n=1 Tax=Ilyomonas limi TaxID=2575867 RepID=A0A4U3KZ15_9BACT|nr:alpha-L-fucosidase [Ilyomonas limi]TKK67662.1 hypothetical protein FC093_12990 [Ilyomonas limi]
MNRLHKQILSTLLLTVLYSFLFAQNYQPTWQSLDSRPVPQWWKDGKFGIFIHWGVYSVPGFSRVGAYAEWYQNGLMSGDSVRIKYHKEKFGDRSYYDLKNDFKAELFDPEAWAKLFEASGAKYIVLTSKHHDGFALWPSKEADRDWGFAWNAVSAGPHRDLLGDLFAAVRKTSVHPGMYYSLYEWYNPLWKTNKPKYISEHMWPQMKDLVNTYKPDVFWTDGEWDLSDEEWKSKDFLAWLYNESPVKNSVVTYDRWGSGVRFHHGEVYTPEYQPDIDFADHAWEESRGMGFSYGYNRAEDAWDYNSAQVLVLSLIDKVSRGGNFLLDIGPDEHGKIPPIMQERLLEIGGWLKINGEAIYNTVRWKTPFQWSEGRTDYKPGKSEKKNSEASSNNDIMLKLTVNPDPGYAVKEIFYTYNPATNSLYAILPKYPSDKKLIIKNTTLPAGTRIYFLSTEQTLQWKQMGDNVAVQLPDYDPNVIQSPYAYVLKIENYGAFAAKPQINITYPNSSPLPTISITAANGSAIHYTVDGSEPTAASPLYTKPFILNKKATIKSIAFHTGNLASNMAVAEAKTYHLVPATKVGTLQQGIAYRYFEPEGRINMQSMQGVPVNTGVTNSIGIDKKQRADKFAFLFEGYINIAKDGIYTFSTSSDDGSALYIDGEQIVNNDEAAGGLEREGKIALKKGYHKIKVAYYDSGGGNNLTAFIQTEGGNKQPIDTKQLFH